MNNCLLAYINEENVKEHLMINHLTHARNLNSANENDLIEMNENKM